MDYDIFLPRYSEYSEDESQENLFAAQHAIEAANQLLYNSRITPQQIVGIGHALYALQRFPITTLGVDVEFGLHIRGVERSGYLTYRITQDSFEISQGGYCEGDHYPALNLYIGNSGYRRKDDIYIYALLNEVEDILYGWLNNDDTKISVINHSYIEGFIEAEIEQNPFNYHLLNQKAKQLLQSKKNYRPLTDELYILQLIYFGLQSLDEGMRQKRQQIRKQHLMQHLEDKVRILRWDIEPAEVMSWLLQNEEFSSLLETDNLIEGANTAMWIVINQMLIDLSKHIQDTLLTPQRQVSLFDTNP